MVPSFPKDELNSLKPKQICKGGAKKRKQVGKEGVLRLQATFNEHATKWLYDRKLQHQTKPLLNDFIGE